MICIKPLLSGNRPWPYMIKAGRTLFTGTYGILGREMTKYTIVCGGNIRFWPALYPMYDSMWENPAADLCTHLVHVCKDLASLMLWHELWIGLTRTVYIHRIRLYFQWCSCQKYRHTPYTYIYIYILYILANPSFGIMWRPLFASFDSQCCWLAIPMIAFLIRFLFACCAPVASWSSSFLYAAPKGPSASC